MIVRYEIVATSEDNQSFTVSIPACSLTLGQAEQELLGLVIAERGIYFLAGGTYSINAIEGENK